MRWIWDERKAAANLKKHRVPFELAALALDDPFSLAEPDPHPDGDRWDVLCQLNSTTLFVVTAWTPSPDRETGRIISARKATSRERRQYHEHWRTQAPDA